MKLFQDRIARNAEGAGGGGAAAAAAPAGGDASKPEGAAAAAPAGTEPGAAGGQASAGQAAGSEGGAAAAWRPDGLPDHLAGKDERETIEKLWNAQKAYRDGQAKFEPPPADPNGYAFEWSDKVKPYAADFGEDAFFKGVREDALKAGLGNKQAGTFLDAVMTRMVDMQLVEAPVDIEAEKAKLAPAEAKNLPAPERDAAIQRRVSTNIAFVDALKEKGLDAQVASDLSAELAAFPALNALVEFVRAGAGEGAAPALGGQPAAGASKADLEKRMADPRQRFGTPTYDADFARETDRLFKQVHGG
jgi:hypothetical protein